MTTLNLDDISPDARASYITVGGRYGSTDTLAQAIETLGAYAKHTAAVNAHGFGAEDAEQLGDAKGLLSAGIGVREGQRTQAKVTSVTWIEAFKNGKKIRQRARAVLVGARNALKRASGAAAQEGMKAVNATLDRTISASDDGELLATQLDELGAVLADPTVSAAAATRGGVEVAIALASAAVTLRSVEPPAGPGTPAETARLNLLDGLIVELTRAARTAGRAASRALGDPSIAVDFELSKLPGRAKKAAPVAPPVG